VPADQRQEPGDGTGEGDELRDAAASGPSPRSAHAVPVTRSFQAVVSPELKTGHGVRLYLIMNRHPQERQYSSATSIYRIVAAIQR